MLDRSKKIFENVQVAGIPVASVSENDLVLMMIDDCFRFRSGELPKARTVVDINGQAISMKETDSDYARALAAADVIHADGQFIVWLSRILPGRPIPERTATTDLIHACAKAAEENGLRFYLLGATEDVSRRCAEELVRLYPGLDICGRRNGFFSESEEDAVIADINASGADIVWVGLGKPKEQIFTMRTRDRMRCGWIVTCGGCFNFITGDYKRAPRWMQKAGLEWLHRMATGPTYLLKRYLLTIPHSLAVVFREDVLGHFRKRKKPDGEGADS